MKTEGSNAAMEANQNTESIYLESVKQQGFKAGYESATKNFNERREEIRLTTIRSIAEAMTSLSHFVDNMNGLMYSGRN